MSDIAVAAKHHHGHHHHGHAAGTKTPFLQMPHIHHLSDVLPVAQGSQGSGAQHAVLFGALVVLIVIALAVRKMRRA